MYIFWWLVLLSCTSLHVRENYYSLFTPSQWSDRYTSSASTSCNIKRKPRWTLMIMNWLTEVSFFFLQCSVADFTSVKGLGTCSNSRNGPCLHIWLICILYGDLYAKVVVLHFLRVLDTAMFLLCLVSVLEEEGSGFYFNSSHDHSCRGSSVLCTCFTCSVLNDGFYETR